MDNGTAAVTGTGIAIVDKDGLLHVVSTQHGAVDPVRQVQV